MCAVGIIFVLAAILPLFIGFSLSPCVLARSFQQKLKQTPKCQERLVLLQDFCNYSLLYS